MQGFLEFNESAEHYNSGYSASKSGKSRQDNPYKEGSLAAKYWAKGYEHHKTGKQPEKFTEEKKIIVKTKMGGEIPATIKVTGKDYHIVKSDRSGKQYKVDHQGNSLEEEIDDKDLPFTPDKPHKPTAKAGKYGAAYSTVRHLARQAMKKQAEKLKKEDYNEDLEEAFINGREYASQGVIHPTHAKLHKVGNQTDFYAHGTGDKLSGKVVKNTGKEVHFQADKIHGGKVHKFTVSSHLPNQQNEETELQENAPVAPSLVKHRIGVTVSDPNHPAVSKRKEKIQKFVVVTHSDNKEGARAVGEKFYKKKGYQVHDSHHAGMVNEEIEEGYRGNSEADKPFFAAQDHKKEAEKARKSGDDFSYHKHMSAHHDAMEQWNSNKGRTHVANQHAMKADQHEDYAQKARKGNK